MKHGKNELARGQVYRLVSLPTWDETEAKKCLNPIEAFIYENEPANRSGAAVFRARLLEALQCAQTAG